MRYNTHLVVFILYRSSAIAFSALSSFLLFSLRVACAEDTASDLVRIVARAYVDGESGSGGHVRG